MAIDYTVCQIPNENRLTIFTNHYKLVDFIERILKDCVFTDYIEIDKPTQLLMKVSYKTFDYKTIESFIVHLLEAFTDLERNYNMIHLNLED